MKNNALLSAALCASTIAPSYGWAQRADQLDRTVLPIPPKPFSGRIGMTSGTSTPSFPDVVQAPSGAPNVILVMTDDAGFAASSTFGGLVPTPVLDRLATSGLRYNNFHTTALCSPSRAALLTGRNHHAVATGALTDIATGYPGYSTRIPKSAASIAEVLRQNGFSTAFFGKHHNVPKPETSSAGPFDSWPTGLGFEYFLGFIGAESDQWTPGLVRGTSRLEQSMEGPLDKILINDAIKWIHNQKAVYPDKPFFLYLAPGSTHAPHQAPKEWIERFRGKFDMGWDAYREIVLTRQIKAGVVPSGTELTPRPEFLPAWNSLSPDRRRIAARLMEVYAAQMAYQDYQFGRLLDEIQRMGIKDNTLVVFIEGDNGGSSEGGERGTSNELATLARLDNSSDPWLLSQLDEFGGPHSHNHYPAGWAWAMNAPFPLFKRYASQLGGIRNGMVISWPSKIKVPGGIRSQFSHLVDIFPTILEAAGVPSPVSVNGTKQQPVNGVSLISTFSSPKASSPHRVQYFEMLGNRGIYQDGWFASTVPPEAGSTAMSAEPKTISVLNYKWALYDLRNDFSQSRDLSARYPERLRAMQDLWLTEAKKNQVLPISNEVSDARVNADADAGQKHRHIYQYWGNDISIPYGAAPAINRLSFKMTAQIQLKDDKQSGVILAYGNKFGGLSFFLKDGKPVLYQSVTEKPSDQSRIASAASVPSGLRSVQLSIRYSSGQSPLVSISIDGEEVASGPLPRPVGMVDLTEGLDIGHDGGLTVTSDYGAQNRLEGLNRVDIEIMD